MVKFLRYLQYAIYFPFNLLFVLLSYILSPILAALSFVFGAKLPVPLQWFGTIDDDLDGGFHQHIEGYDSGAKGFSLWWQRTCWVCRNPAHGWQSIVLGFKGENKGFTFKRDIVLTDSYYLKLWLGWSNRSYDGTYFHYLFQSGIKKRKI
jgi:hypothetical protein